MNENFEKVLEEVLNSTTLTEVEKYGCPLLNEGYTNDLGEKVRIKIYELSGKTYLIRYVNEKCVQFKDITTKTKS